MATSSALTMSATTARMSASPKPRVVSGGVPKRMPLGFSALLSPGTVFLFTEMPTSSRILGRRREAFGYHNFRVTQKVSDWVMLT